MNLDGGDYHPLYAQRKTIGFAQMTEVVELANKNFAAIFSDKGAAHGAGTLAVFNRSVGPDQTSTDPADYTADPNAIGWPVSNFFLHSLGVVDPRATGHTGAGNSGAYRSPAPLPNGQIIVSYAANAADPAASRKISAKISRKSRILNESAQLLDVWPEWLVYEEYVPRRPPNL